MRFQADFEGIAKVNVDFNEIGSEGSASYNVL